MGNLKYFMALRKENPTLCLLALPPLSPAANGIGMGATTRTFFKSFISCEELYP
jgi:hypothetical protein